jgi:hypothetical protein
MAADLDLHYECEEWRRDAHHVVPPSSPGGLSRFYSPITSVLDPEGTFVPAEQSFFTPTYQYSRKSAWPGLRAHPRAISAKR